MGASKKIVHSARQSEGQASFCNTYRGTASIDLGIFEMLLVNCFLLFRGAHIMPELNDTRNPNLNRDL